MKNNFLTNYFLFVVLFEKVSMKYVLVRIDQNRTDIGGDYRQLKIGLPTAHELTCVEGYIKRNWKSYLTAWSTFSFPPGNTLSNQEACWRLVKQKFDNAVGLLFNHNVGFCRGIINAGPLLPWPTFFPDSRTTVKLCILKNVAGIPPTVPLVPNPIIPHSAQMVTIPLHLYTRLIQNQKQNDYPIDQYY